MARTLRTEAKLDPKQQLEGALYSRTAALEVARRHAEAIQKLANVKLEFKAEAAPKAGAMRSTAEFDLVLRSAAVAGGSAAQAPRQRSASNSTKNIANLERQLADEVFLGQRSRASGGGHPPETGRIQSAAGESSTASAMNPRSCASRSKKTSARAMSPARACVPAGSRARADIFWRASRWCSPAPKCCRRSTSASRCSSTMATLRDGETDRRRSTDRARTAARTRARGAEFSAAPERSGDAGAPVRRGRRGHRIAACSIRARPRPGCDVLEKRAAAAGGVTNHRMGLFDAVLIKNNHIAAARRRARSAHANERAGCAAGCPSRSKSARAPNSRSAGMPAPSTCCSTTSLPPKPPTGSAKSPAAPKSKSPAASRCECPRLRRDRRRLRLRRRHHALRARHGYQLPPGAAVNLDRRARGVSRPPHRLLPDHRLHHASPPPARSGRRGRRGADRRTGPARPRLALRIRRRHLLLHRARSVARPHARARAGRAGSHRASHRPGLRPSLAQRPDARRTRKWPAFWCNWSPDSAPSPASASM